MYLTIYVDIVLFVLFRYKSSGKSFSEVSTTKHISVSIDAIVIFNSLWKPSKAAAAAKR